MSTTQPIRSYTDIQKLKNYYLEKEAYRDYLLVCVCLNTALRINDVLNLKWSDLLLPSSGRVKSHIKITETKTGKQTIIKINKALKRAIKLYIKNSGIQSDYVFTNQRGGKLSRVSAFSIIKNGGKAINLEYEISCHSLRKTFGYHAWKMGTPPAVLMQIYNHSSYNITKRYLGIAQEDKDRVYGTVSL
jgi:integrase